MPDPTWRRRSSSSVISRSSSFVSGHVLLTEYLHEESPLVRVTSTAVVQSQACPHVGLVFLEYGVKPIVLNDPIHRTNKRKKGGRLHTCLDELLRQAQDSSSSTHHAKQTNKALDQTLLLPPFSVRSNCQSTIIAHDLHALETAVDKPLTQVDLLL